jgi:hypothetical protein
MQSIYVYDDFGLLTDRQNAQMSSNRRKGLNLVIDQAKYAGREAK